MFVLDGWKVGLWGLARVGVYEWIWEDMDGRLGVESAGLLS